MLWRAILKLLQHFRPLFNSHNPFTLFYPRLGVMTMILQDSLDPNLLCFAAVVGSQFLGEFGKAIFEALCGAETGT